MNVCNPESRLYKQKSIYVCQQITKAHGKTHHRVTNFHIFNHFVADLHLRKNYTFSYPIMSIFQQLNIHGDLLCCGER